MKPPTTFLPQMLTNWITDLSALLCPAISP